MNVVETLLVFVAIPLGGFALLTALVFGRTAVRQTRYRPGRPWNYAPVWYLPHRDDKPAHAPAALAARPALPAGSRAHFVDESRPAAPGTYGGATGEW